MAQEKIIINFKAAGHEALITAVKQLDNAIADLVPSPSVITSIDASIPLVSSSTLNIDL